MSNSPFSEPFVVDGVPRGTRFGGKGKAFALLGLLVGFGCAVFLSQALLSEPMPPPSATEGAALMHKQFARLGQSSVPALQPKQLARAWQPAVPQPARSWQHVGRMGPAPALRGTDTHAIALEKPSSSDTLKAEMTQLDRLKTMTSVVADTGDFDAIKAFRPEDSTTNPSLLLAVAKMEKFQPLLQEAANEARKNDGALSGEDLITDVCDRFAVKVGVKLLALLPAHGRVSTEVDADLSFDTEASIAKAKKILALYAAENIQKERILIKLGSTWESIQACRQLEKEGITCNMTLLFSIVQAIACAEAGATLISPFVGRILDWYKQNTDKKEYTSEEDPGVQSVRDIYRYYKKYGYDTIVMGASFRNTGEILGLAGCDKLTIAPKLLDELAASSESFEQVLKKECVECNHPQVSFDEKGFRWAMNEDAMATKQLSEGLRNFAKDGRALRDYVKQTVLK